MTGPVTTEALVAALELLANDDSNETVRGISRDALQQVTAERDEWKSTLRYCERQWQDERGAMLDKIARLRAEGEAKDRALLLLLPFVDYAAGEGLMFVETEDGEHPEMDAADIMVATAQALGLELGSDACLALLSAGYDAIRATRAATAREGA